MCAPTFAQILADRPVADHITPLETPSSSSIAKERALIDRIYEPELLLRVEPTQSKIIKTNYQIHRTAISHPEILDMQVFGENEIEIIGKKIGETTLTFWFEIPGQGAQVLRYYVQVEGAPQEQRRREARYKQLQSRINEFFPNSQIFLFPIDDKVIVRGQARDSQEAANIMQLLGEENRRSRNGFNNNSTSRFFLRQVGRSSSRDGRDFDDDFDRDDADDFINLLHVPGEQQVMLKVRVAEVVRNSNRASGTDITAVFDSFEVGHLISGGGNLSAILNDGDVEFFLKAVASHGYGKILAEPTLVTISGKTARFLAGGEFAVPTSVGIDGIGAASTTFRGFGTELQFTPTVIDKDLVRLEVAPSFSSINDNATVGGIPGLNRRSVETTVDLREGQWLAVAGLIQDEQGGNRSRLPYLGDLPILGNIFSSQNTTRFETELIVLVSPELVHPLETEQLPLILPGMDITDPTDDDFFKRHLIEGYQGFDHRSTVWPEMRHQMRGVQQTEFLRRISHGIKRRMDVQSAYVSGPSGFSE